jgi:hypothetical protein
VESIEKTSLMRVASKSEIEAALREDHFRKIDTINWQDYSEMVSCQWKMLHGPDAFFIYFETLEPYVRAKCTGDSGPVCEDSCVEFFLSLNDKEYYNFEFNPIGAYTIQKGSNRSARKKYRWSELKDFRIWTSESGGSFDTMARNESWEVWCVIPFSFFGTEKMNRVKANFYKCGDALPNKHYLSWTPVKTEQPDFHRPEYFSELFLEP